MYTFRGRQGIQGFTGATGTSTFVLTTVLLDPTLTTNSKEYTIIAMAPSNGTITFFGQISFDASALNTTTVTPSVAGSAMTALEAKTTTPLGQFNSVTISGTVAITVGQAFTVNVVVTGGGTIDINTGALTYVIQ